MKLFKKPVKDMQWSTLSKKGGNTTKERHGSEYYARIGRKGRETILKKNPDFYKQLAVKGLEARKQKKVLKQMEKHMTQSSVDRLAKLLNGSPSNTS